MIDKFNFDRKLLVTFVCVFGCLGGIVFTTQSGLLWLDIVDRFITHYGLVTVGILECIVIGWAFDLFKLRQHINRISSLKLGMGWALLIKLFVPLMLGIIFLGDLFNELQRPYGGYSWAALILIGRDWLILTLIAAFIVAGRPWRSDRPSKPGRSVKNRAGSSAS